MAEFDDIRKSLNKARLEAHSSEREIFRLKQQLARLKRERSQTERSSPQVPGSSDPDGEPSTPIDDVQGVKALEQEIKNWRGTLVKQKATELGDFTRFIDFTDPRKNIARLSDSVPVLLMPLRIETRFKFADDIEGRQNELWVRVYPDDISVDVFEDTLSESEVKKARVYWSNIWSAAGNESAERGAWRVYLSGQGAGRSHWVIQNYRPLNEAEQPTGVEGSPTIILTVTTQAALQAPEKESVSHFWEDLWRAGDDGEAQLVAYNALVAEVGAARALIIQTDYKPVNFSDLPPPGFSREESIAVVAYLEFASDEAVAVREASWSQAPHVNTLPDRLVLLGYNNDELELELLGQPIPSPLAVGPDPSAEESEQLRKEGAEVKVDPDMAWLTDFEKAIEVGMGFKVPLSTVNFRRGFDKLMVLGVRMRSDADNGKTALQELIAHHHHSKSGFSFLPQGRPTNNVDSESAAYSWQEDSDISFDHYFGEQVTADEGFEKSDGSVFAELLGLDKSVLQGIPFYQRTDSSDAAALNTALWPATLGYFMDSMLDPVFDDNTIEQTRDFFTHHVSARGQLPAIRVGKQPYMILPATPRSRMEWFIDRSASSPSDKRRSKKKISNRFLRKLYQLLRKVEADFEPLLEKVSYIGKGGDQQQILLDVIGLHSGSVEQQQRYAESFTQIYNRLAMQGAGGAFTAILIGLAYVISGLALLKDLGYEAEEGAEIPDILEKLFLGSANELKGGLVDDMPLSEIKPIRQYTDTGENYIAWLIEASSTSHDALRLQKGFTDNVPTALLYLMLHHALDLSFVETSIRLFFNAGLIDQGQLKAAKREPKFTQVQQASLVDPASAGGSRWQYLYRKEAAVAGNMDRTIGEFIPTVLTSMTATAYLKRQLDALKHLKDKPTAVLERVFAEHLDLCTYRFDAWYGGLLHYQLEQMRTNHNTGVDPLIGEGAVTTTVAGTITATTADGTTTTTIDESDDADFNSGSDSGSDSGSGVETGIFLGAYGWLENVKPEFKQMQPVELSNELSEIFEPEADPPLMRDNKNQGYIHAPSLNHAVTAAVLRNGYLSNATSENPDSLAINLSSERVRIALSIIEGMKAEQGLGALLGYQFERGLHDRYAVEVDEFILDLRKVFPLVGDRVSPTRTGKMDALGKKLNIRRVEARNVLDGLSLIEHLRETGNTSYPFGLDEDLPSASGAQAAAITAEAERIVNIADAVADLAMAESVHQVVQGNYDRAGAVLDTYSKGKFPSTPDVIRTPRSGVALSHRVALHLTVGLDPADPSLTSPRAKAEPAINDWLRGVLPAANLVACEVIITDPLEGTDVTQVVTQADLGLLPIDLLYILDADDDRSNKTLDDLIETHVINLLNPRPHTALAIRYKQRIPALAGHVPFFELTALIRALRSILLRSRPLRATDMMMSQEASDEVDVDIVLAPARVTLVRDQFNGHLGDLIAFQTALQNRLDAEQTTEIATEIEQRIEDFAGLMIALGPYAALDTGTSAIYADRRVIFSGMLFLAENLITRWDGRLGEFDLAIEAYNDDPGASEDKKFLALQMAERLLSTERTDPLPPAPNTLRDDLMGIKRLALQTQRDSIENLKNTATSLSELHDGINDAKPVISTLDPTEVALDEHSQKIIVLAEDMANRALILVTDITVRLATAQTQLEAQALEVGGKKKIDMLTTTARLMLGEDFQVIPDFAIPETAGNEWENAWGPAATADQSMLDYLKTKIGRRFPMDDWFTGISRVREKMHDLESIGHLSNAFTGTEIPLQALQFPYRAELPWLGMEFPETKADGDPFLIEEDKLLYTAHYTQAFQKNARQAGLLLDEWTEVIPSRTEDTGLAFHFDRPNSEPPQTLLLALPPKITGEWRWQDLVDTVHETMDLAKKRAIEPEHIDTTAYARFLPAMVSAVTLYPITASLNFSFNNNLAAVMADADGEEA